MTGRAAGFCAGFQQPGYAHPAGRGFGGGRGFGFGRGAGFGRRRGGRGFRNRFYATGLTGYERAAMAGAPQAGAMTSSQQLDALKTQAEYFSEALEDIHRRIEEIQSETDSD